MKMEVSGVMSLAPDGTPLPFAMLRQWPCLVGYLFVGVVITLSFQASGVATLDTNTTTTFAIVSQFKTVLGLIAAVAVAIDTCCD